MSMFGIQVQALSQLGNFLLTISGSLDMRTAMDLEQKCSELLVKKDEKLILDFTRVDYINSQGLAALLQLQKTLNAKGGGVVVASLSERVEKVFIATGVHKVISLYGSVADALAQDSLFQKR